MRVVFDRVGRESRCCRTGRSWDRISLIWGVSAGICSVIVTLGSWRSVFGVVSHCEGAGCALASPAAKSRSLVFGPRFNGLLAVRVDLMSGMEADHPVKRMPVPQSPAASSVRHLAGARAAGVGQHSEMWPIGTIRRRVAHPFGKVPRTLSATLSRTRSWWAVTVCILLEIDSDVGKRSKWQRNNTAMTGWWPRITDEDWVAPPPPRTSSRGSAARSRTSESPRSRVTDGR